VPVADLEPLGATVEVPPSAPGIIAPNLRLDVLVTDIPWMIVVVAEAVLETPP